MPFYSILIDVLRGLKLDGFFDLFPIDLLPRAVPGNKKSNVEFKISPGRKMRSAAQISFRNAFECRVQSRINKLVPPPFLWFIHAVLGG